MPARDQLTALDATFLELEQADDSALMHIGSAMLFEPLAGGGTPTIVDVREHLRQRLSRLPRYGQKLGTPRTGGLAWPYWERDDRFEIEAHVRHATLPAPGDEPELLEWVSDYYSHRLDRRRPLWEMILLDGLEGGRWALVTKTHHCLVDGVGSVGILELLLDADPVTEQSPAPLTTAVDEVRRVSLPHPPAPVRQAAGAGIAAARAGAHALIHPRDALERSRAVIELLLRDELVAAPSTSLNVPIGSTRRIATVRIKLEEVQKIRSTFGGKVNDVLLCAAAGGLRELLLHRGEDPPRSGLRAMVPVNIRRESDNGELGNKISSLFVELPVAEADPLHRYELVRVAAEKHKSHGQALGSQTLIGLTELAPPILHASLAQSLYASRLFNITITNVPGSPEPVYVFGAPMIGLVPIVPLAADHAVGIVIVSYAGWLTFGICADRATMPDLDVLRDRLEACLHELVTLAGNTPTHRPKTPTRSRRRAPGERPTTTVKQGI